MMMSTRCATSSASRVLGGATDDHLRVLQVALHEHFDIAAKRDRSLHALLVDVPQALDLPSLRVTA